MVPSIAEGSPAPFLNGVRGHLGRFMPQLDDDTSATDLRKLMEEEEKNISETVREIKNRRKEGLGLGLLTCATEARCWRRRGPPREDDNPVSRTASSGGGTDGDMNSHIHRDREGR
jgi:hypothetical protein